MVSDGKRERELVLVEKIVVGRDPTCDLSHDDALLSRRHAEFIAGSDRVTVRDLGSRNGVFVNGLRAAERTLEPGDVVQIGPLRVRYTHDHQPASILPEQLIADATMVAQPPAGPRPVSSPPAPSAPEMAGLSPEDERTRVFSPAGLEAAAMLDPELQDGPTVFMAPPAASAARPLPPVAATAPDDFAPDISGYVFGQVAAVAGVVLLSSLVPLMVGRTAPISRWVAFPIFAAVVSTYLVGRLINRRVVRIWQALKPDMPVGGDRFR